MYPFKAKYIPYQGKINDTSVSGTLAYLLPATMSKNQGEYMMEEHVYRHTGNIGGAVSGDILLTRSPIGACGEQSRAEQSRAEQSQEVRSGLWGIGKRLI